MRSWKKPYSGYLIFTKPPSGDTGGRFRCVIFLKHEQARHRGKTQGDVIGVSFYQKHEQAMKKWLRGNNSIRKNEKYKNMKI